MTEANLSQIMELKQKSLGELKTNYKELFGQEPPFSNKVFLWRKIAYRIQELECGNVSEQTQGKIQELIKKYDPVNNTNIRPDNENGQIGKKNLAGIESSLSQERSLLRNIRVRSMS